MHEARRCRYAFGADWARGSRWAFTRAKNGRIVCQSQGPALMKFEHLPLSRTLACGLAVRHDFASGELCAQVRKTFRG